MNKKEEIEDSLEFCRDIKLYTQPINHIKSTSEYSDSMSSANLKEYVDWLNIIEHSLANPSHMNNSARILKTPQSLEITEKKKPSHKNRSKSILREVSSVAACILVAFVIAYFITTFIGQHTKVEGASMEETLKNNDYLIIDKLSYRFSDPKRYDIIVFPFDEDIYYVKRIIGMPGENVLIKDGEVYINDVLLRENYGNELIEDPGNAATEIELSEDEYFVLGDNRNNSKDSRRAEVGLIQRNKIVGKACFRIYPFHKFGVLKN